MFNPLLDVSKSAVHGCRVVFRMVVINELLEARLLLEEREHWTMEPCEPASMECANKPMVRQLLCTI